MSTKPTKAYKAKKLSDPQAELIAILQANPSLRLPTFTKIDETRDRSKALTSLIWEHHARINVYLDHWADTIQQRWQNKTVAQRVKVLDEAWKVAGASMAQSCHPDIAACLDYGLAKIPPKNIRIFQIPEVNRDDLSKARPLMIMMESRARNHPEAFAASDRASMYLGIKTRILNAPMLPAYTMHLSGRKSEKRYGQLERWEIANEAEQTLKEGIGIEPGEGIDVLEKQATLLNFLVNCAKLILPDITQGRVDAIAEQEVSPSPKSSISHQSSNNSPLDVLIEAPFRLPVSIKTINFDRLSCLVYAKHAEAADHLWNLRQDPGYFLSTLLDFSEHQSENLLDAQGNKHPRLHTPAYWQRVTTGAMRASYTATFSWRLTAQRFIEVKDLYLSQYDQLSPGKRLPVQLEKSICKLLDRTQRLLNMFTEFLSLFVESSPPMQKHHFRSTLTDMDNPRMDIFKRSKRKVTLFWLLEQLQSIRAVRFYGLHNLLRYVHRIMLVEPSGRNPVSGYLARVLSDMAIVDEIEWNISLMRLKERGTPAVNSKALDMHSDAESQPLKDLFPQLQPQPEWNYSEAPTKAFEYPVDEERTEATTNRMRLSEENLDALWERVGGHGMKGKTGEEWFREIAPTWQDRKLKRTPAWGITDVNAGCKQITFGTAFLPAALKNLDVSLSQFNAVINNIVGHGEPKEVEEAVGFLEKAVSLEEKALGASKEPLQCNQAPEDVQARQDIQGPVSPCCSQESKKAEVILPEREPEPIPLPQASKSSPAMHQPARLNPSPEGVPNTLPNTVTTKPTARPPMAVGKKAYKVFRTMFPANSQGDDNVPQPAMAASVQWSDFVNAMSKIGFSAEKFVGSAWLFTRKRGDEICSPVIFHEPHPGHVISGRMAKFMGERLGWQFKMKRESFVRAIGEDE
ncbi:MAG: hypothetical protein Q9183_001793 [Haloplaca sp. 2 TL-2023]